MNKPYLNLKGRVNMLFRDNEDALHFLAILAILSLVSFGGLFFVSNTPLKNDIEVASLYGNKCIKERNGAILEEDHSLIIKYTMESEGFDIFCYNEMITDMNSQNVGNIWETRYAIALLLDGMKRNTSLQDLIRDLLLLMPMSVHY